MSTSGQKRAVQDLHSSFGQLQLVLELAGAVSRAQKPEDIYQIAVQGLISALGADRAAVLIVDSDRVLRFKVWTGLSEEYRMAAEAWAPSRQQPADAIVAVDDVLQRPSLSSHRQMFAKEGIGAYAVIPLLGSGSLIGKFILFYNAPHAFGTEELQLAQTIATHVAFAAERLHAETALRDSEQRLSAILFKAAVGIAQVDLNGEWLFVNNRYCEMLGYTQAELRGKKVQEITHPKDLESVMEGRRRLLAGEISSHTMEKRYIRKDGSIVWGKLHRSVVRDENNQPQYLISVVEEITERILAEHALKESEQRLSLALSTGLGVWDCDLRTKSPGVSPQYTKFVGHPPRDPAEWLTLVHPDDRERVLALVDESLQRTREWGAEFRLLCPDGSVRWMLSKAVVILDSAGQPARMLGVSLDITNRKETETALRQAEQLNKQILDIIPDCIFVLDVTSDGRFRFVSLNPAEEKAVGLTSAEVSGKFVDAVLPEEVASKVIAQYRRCLEAGTLIYYEDELNLPVGLRHFRTNLIPVRDSAGGIHRIVGCCVDLTEVRCAQEEALARQKLESMGVLAGGIAHDFNNLLGGIIASAELAMKASADGSPLDDLRRIRTAAIRGGEIVRQLMIYGGKESPALEPVDLSLLIEEMLELLKVSISKHAVLKINLSRDLPGVEASPTQIRQVVMNLITNASEAIGERDGVISISTASIAVGQHPANLPENNYLQLEVSDTGVGMTPEVQTKIFDPFFTTKFPGRGLGLAVVRGIVRDHRGAIEFASVPGRGTTCLVWLPCTAKMTPETRNPTAPVVTEKIEVPAATVLMVEDEDLLRIAVSKGLRRRGFSVLEASDGSAAVELIHAHPAGIDIVLLDVTLPGMSSREILEEVARMQPHPKVILTSAYSKEAVEPSFAGLRVQRFIRKPFQLSELVDVLREAISE